MKPPKNILKALWSRLFKITPLKLSVIITLFFMTVAIVYDVNPLLIPVMQAIEQKSIDLKFRFRGVQKPKSKIVIVTADEKSFQTFGQWPFDRGTVFAPMLSKICGYGPTAFGLDIVWTDPESRMPGGVKSAITQLLGSKAGALDSVIAKNSGDNLLYKAVEECKQRVVMGYAMINDLQNGLPEEEFVKRLGVVIEAGNILDAKVRGEAKFARFIGDSDANVDFYNQAATGLLNLTAITPPGVAQGFFNNEGDNDGNYRRALLFYKAADFFLPSMTLRMAQKAVTPGDRKVKLFVQPEEPSKGKSQQVRLEIITKEELRRIPTDTRGQTIVNFRGPNYMFPNVSLADVLNKNSTIEYDTYELDGQLKHHKVEKAELFKDALVLFGVTAIGLYDIRPRPFDPTASGVENHANILDNIVNDDFLVRPASDMLVKLWIGLLALSLLYGYVISRLDAKYGALCATIAISVLLWFDQTQLFNKGTVFLGYVQAAQLLLQYIAITVLKYMQEESEKKFIRGAFGKYVSPAVVDTMLKDPTKLQLGGDKRDISIMFSDIRSFTEISEKMDVKSLTGMLNEYLGAMTDILQANQGTLDKYIGDAVMCFWNAPLDVPNHASAAVKTTVQMLTKVDDLNVQFKEKYGISLDIGLGINTGPVSVGNFGSQKVFSYTVIGDNVNLASRLESLNKYYGTHIIISETTFAQIDPKEFLTREVDTVKVKGKKKPVKIYEVFPDNEAHAPLKSSLVTFNEALSNYYGKNWKKATEAFKEVLSRREGDKPSLEMLQRIQHYLKTPPDADWDGSWEMTSK